MTADVTLTHPRSQAPVRTSFLTPDARRFFTSPGGLALLYASTTLVALCCFALSAYGLYGYGLYGLHIGRLAALVPACVDLLSLCGIYATYVTRNSPWHIRAYAWMVFGVAVVVSILGNVADGVLRGLVLGGVIGAAFPPIFLAASIHLVIVVRRAVERATADDIAASRWEAALREAAGVPVASGSSSPHNAVVYRLWGSDGRPIRIGSTVDLPTRLSRYRLIEWWPEVVQVTYQPFATLDEARRAEVAAIRAERPVHNVQHKPRADGTTTEADTLTPARRATGPLRASGRRPLDSRRAEAVRRVIEGGELASKVAESIGERPRNLQNWVKAERARRAATSRDVTPAAVNGAEILQLGELATDAPVPKR